MKEIISFVMPKELCKDCIVTKCRKMLKDKTQCYLNRKPYVLVENKVPETFEELKELCENIIGIRFGKTGQTQDTEYISLDNKLYFYKDGTVDFGFDNLAYTITPSQMYQIIKSLIGEEK